MAHRGATGHAAGGATGARFDCFAHLGQSGPGRPEVGEDPGCARGLPRLLRVSCDPDGGMELDRDFFADFHDRPDGPARAHEVRPQGGDCTTEIFQ
jgi:56kDa selenium binding protein (SBP56)